MSGDASSAAVLEAAQVEITCENGLGRMLDGRCAARWREANGKTPGISSKRLGELQASKCAGCPWAARRAAVGLHLHVDTSGRTYCWADEESLPGSNGGPPAKAKPRATLVRLSPAQVRERLLARAVPVADVVPTPQHEPDAKHEPAPAAEPQSEEQEDTMPKRTLECCDCRKTVDRTGANQKRCPACKKTRSIQEARERREAAGAKPRAAKAAAPAARATKTAGGDLFARALRRVEVQRSILQLLEPLSEHDQAGALAGVIVELGLELS
jgi:hypothetical protein